MEAHEPSLTSRRLNLSLNYVLKLKSLPENPVYKHVFEPENTQLFEESEWCWWLAGVVGGDGG